MPSGFRTTFTAGTAEELATELADHFSRVADAAWHQSMIAIKIKDRNRWDATGVAYKEASDFCRRLTADLSAAKSA